MACGCGGRNRVAGSTITVGGQTATIAGFEVTFPDGTQSTFLTQLEAKTARRKAGGGTIRPVVDSG